MEMSRWQFGINAGAMIYQGDLAPTALGSYRTPSLNAGIYFSRVLNPSFALRTNVVFGKLRGNDAAYKEPNWRQQRNYNFNTPVTEISELLVWNIFGNNGNELGQRFSPYLMGGAGITFLNVKRDYSKLNPDLFADGTKQQLGLLRDSAATLPKAIAIIPVGIGLEFYISKRVSLTAETLARFTFSDYLDGFKYAVNPQRNDYYHSHNIGLIVRFGKNNQFGCPVFKY